MKTCTRCHTEKALSEFTLNPGGSVRAWCRKCCSEISDKARVEGRAVPEKRLRQMVSAKKAISKQNGVEFSISVSDLSLPEVCPYLGVKIDLSGSRSRYGPSIDRIDSGLGYVPGNVEVISALANRMKNDATPEELEAFAKTILNK